MLFVGFEFEVGGCGDDAVDGGEFFTDETCNSHQVGGGDEEEKVVGTAHEVDGIDFFEFANAFCDAVEAAVAFWGDADFNDGGDAFFGDEVVVDDGLPTADDAIVFKLLNRVRDFVGGDA